jgi:hypothetical protein
MYLFHCLQHKQRQQQQQQQQQQVSDRFSKMFFFASIIS